MRFRSSGLTFAVFVAGLIFTQMLLVPTTSLLEVYHDAFFDGNGTVASSPDAMKLKSNQTNNITATEAPNFKLAGNQGKEKPLLLLHIGPPKTATTILQDGFLEFQDVLLERDNIYYCKHKESKAAAYKITLCGVNPNSTAADECWSNLRERLQNSPGRPPDSHVLFSAEPMSIGVRHWQHRMNRRAPIDWLSVRDQLGQDWRPAVILGYRRLMDWLPSAEQQIWRWNGAKRNLNKWPKEKGKGYEYSLFSRKGGRRLWSVENTLLCYQTAV